MRRRPVWIGALALAVLLVGAVLPVRVAPEAPEAASDDTVVARIGETTYTLADIRQRLARLEAPYRYAAERRLPEYVREVVRREVLAREARRLGLDRAPALQADLEEAVQTILLRALVKQVMIEAMPGPEEVQSPRVPDAPPADWYGRRWYSPDNVLVSSNQPHERHGELNGELKGANP